jgi:hypothetical protein
LKNRSICKFKVRLTLHAPDWRDTSQAVVRLVKGIFFPVGTWITPSRLTTTAFSAYNFQ